MPCLMNWLKSFARNTGGQAEFLLYESGVLRRDYGNGLSNESGIYRGKSEKWLPGMNEYQRKHAAASMYDAMEALRELFETGCAVKTVGCAGKNYQRQDQMLMDLSYHIKYTANIELQRIMNQAFIDVLLEEAKTPGMNLNKLTNKAVYLLCWLKRYRSQLFLNWKAPRIGCFLYLGGCKNDNEALFLRFCQDCP